MKLSEVVFETMKIDPAHEPPYMFPANRWTFLPWLFDAAGFRVGVEVGVGGGRFAKRLLETVPNLKLVAIDPWWVYGHYESRYQQSHLDRDYRKAKEVLAPYNCEIVRGFSADVVQKVQDGSLDFVHLDANESFDYVLEDLRNWTPKVRQGGIICGTCYYNFRDHAYCQVKDAVDAYTRAHGIDPWFVAVHARYPLWFWEKL